MGKLRTSPRFWHMRPTPNAWACVLMLAGCSQDNARSPSWTFAELPQVLEHVDKAEMLVLYEGLPYQNLEVELFDKERRRTATVNLDGYLFYSDPVSIDDDALAALRRLCATPTFYQEYPDTNAAKACGGFHPDWCLIATQGNKTFNVHYCFGCHDVKVFANGKLLILCEMKDPNPLKELVKPMRNNRPESAYIN